MRTDIDAREIFNYVDALEDERDALLKKVESLEEEIQAHECPECDREHAEANP